MILRLFLFWRIGLLLLTYLGSFTLPKVANGGLGAPAADRDFDFWASWAQWDGGHYYEIAKFGYQEYSDFAFFPLYPALTKFFAAFLKDNYLISGLLVSNMAFLIFLFLFLKLIKKSYPSKVAYTSLVSFLVFPTTFFAVALYSESIFLLLAVLVFLFLKKQKYFFATIAISFAGTARLLGWFLAIPAFYAYLAKLHFKITKISLRFLCSLLTPPLGFVIYSIYFGLNFNDPFKYLSSQSFWLRSISDPAATIFSSTWSIFTGQPRLPNDYLDLFLTLLFLVTLILGVRKISSSLWIFSMLAILIPASGGTLTSMPRYLLASLGTFIIIGQFLTEKPKLKIPVWGVSLALQEVLAVLFINGHWVA